MSCTIEGFCAWAGISRSAFYETYGKQYPDTLTRMREECEIDARMKFELGVIDPKLAPLWMSRYGYSAKPEETGDSDALKKARELLEGIESAID